MPSLRVSSRTRGSARVGGPATGRPSVGVIGGLGGFLCPMLFGALLQRTGLWTTCWMFFFALSIVCLAWMHAVIQRMQREAAPRRRGGASKGRTCHERIVSMEPS